MKTLGFGRAGALLLAVAALGGCADQDSPGTPTGNTATEAQQQALSAIQMVDTMVADSHALAAGDLSGFSLDTIQLPHRHTFSAPTGRGLRDGASAVWRPEEGAWVYEESYTDADGSLSVAFRVQFLDGHGAVQTGPDDTTDSIHYALSLNMQGTGSDERSSEPVRIDFSFAQELQIAALQSPTYVIGGTGSMNGSVEGRTDGRNWNYATTMDWGVDVTVPADGSACASGTVSVGVDDWSVVATYDAASQTYAWSMYQDGGSVPVGTGTGTSACAAGSTL